MNICYFLCTYICFCKRLINSLLKPRPCPAPLEERPLVQGPLDDLLEELLKPVLLTVLAAALLLGCGNCWPVI